jgi:hypothetical protein
MNDRKKSELAMLVRVDQHMTDNPFEPPNAKATLHAAAVKTAKDTMLTVGGTKDQSRGEFRAAALDRQIVIKDLRRQMREIAETAKVLDRTGTIPGLALQFRMPSIVMQDLRDRAAAFKAAAMEHEPDFVAYNSAATFIADLTAAIAAFDTVTGRRYTALGKQVGATAALTATAREGITAVRALNAIMIKRYRDNPTKLAEWKAAQRIANWPSQTVPVEGSGSGGTPPGSGTPPAGGS